MLIRGILQSADLDPLQYVTDPKHCFFVLELFLPFRSWLCSDVWAGGWFYGAREPVGSEAAGSPAVRLHAAAALPGGDCPLRRLKHRAIR
jgi:hypothetical protein